MRITILVFCIVFIFFGSDSQTIEHYNIEFIQWSYDGTKIAIGYANNSIKVFQQSDMSILFTTLPKEDTYITGIGWDLNGTKLAVGFDFYGIEVWDVTNSQLIQFIPTHSGGLAWNNEGNLLVGTGDIDTAILRKYDVTTGLVLMQNNLFTGELSLISNGSVVLSYNISDVLFINSSTLSVIDSITPNSISRISQVAQSPNGQFLAIGFGDNKIQIWDMNTEQTIITLVGGGLVNDFTLISDISFNNMSSRLFATSRTGGIQVWDTSTWMLIESIEINSLLTSNASFSPSGRQIAFAPIDENLAVIIRDMCDFVAPDLTTLLTIMPQANTFGEEAQICLTENATYTLTASLPQITGDITLMGNGATITMTGGAQIFNVAQNGALTLKNVTISGGNATEGGAIYNAGELNLENVILENNSALRGGAIYNAGVLTMNGGAIQNNVASEFGGGIYNVGEMNLDGVNIRENDAPEGSGVYQGE